MNITGHSVPATSKNKAHIGGISCCEDWYLAPGGKRMGRGQLILWEKNIHDRLHKILQCLCCLWENRPGLMEHTYLNLPSHHVLLQLISKQKRNSQNYQHYRLRHVSISFVKGQLFSESSSLFWVTVGYWSPYCGMCPSWRLARDAHNGLSAG